MDEFAFRRGVRYGAILVDIESRQPVDVLPDRTSETLAPWLHDHPRVEVVCRDRASAVKETAPQAIKPYLQAEFAAGNTVATELYQQIRERGFRGGYSTLSRYVGTLLDGTAIPAPAAPIPAPRKSTGWIMRPRENLPPRETHALE
ncbi:transposase [Streptomyces mirabilis]|uniref:transposase n=1 Tax=Streptomyces mirabilis TaxID=68239 RepID=UPI003328E0FF